MSRRSQKRSRLNAKQIASIILLVMLIISAIAILILELL